MNHTHVGRRVKELREGRGMQQEEIKDLLGLNSRQIVSQIETGVRKLSAPELVRILKHFDVTLERLTNPFLLMGRSAFSWRQRGLSLETLDAFEDRAGEWIGAYRALNDLGPKRHRRLLPNTGLTYGSTFEQAAAVGEAVAEQLGLGAKPAFKLSAIMEDQLDILVLMVDALPGISGAACSLPELNAVLINRNESFARRNSDLAHEFFHILTWMEMRPARIETSEAAWDVPNSPRAKSGGAKPHQSQDAARNQRIEQLADNFASGLLLPRKALDQVGKPQGDHAQWLTEAAAFLGVSSRNLKWRLVNSKIYPEFAAVDEVALTAAGCAQMAASHNEEAPLSFSLTFMATIAAAIEQGELSGQRAAALLGIDRDAVGDLCDAYGLERPVELGGRLKEEAGSA